MIVLFATTLLMVVAVSSVKQPGADINLLTGYNAYTDLVGALCIPRTDVELI
jgi:hypothetical protein